MLNRFWIFQMESFLNSFHQIDGIGGFVASHQMHLVAFSHEARSCCIPLQLDSIVHSIRGVTSYLYHTFLIDFAAEKRCVFEDHFANGMSVLALAHSAFTDDCSTAPDFHQTWITKQFVTLKS